MATCCGKHCWQFLLVFLLFYSFTLIDGRKHKLRIEGDDRKQIPLTTFGFLKNGFLFVNITSLSIMPTGLGSIKVDDAPSGTFGFTLDKTVSNGISPFLEGKEDKCILTEGMKEDKGVSVIFFRMDFKQQKFLIERKGEAFANLSIYHLSEADYNLQSGRQRRSAGDLLGDTYLMAYPRVKREAGEPTGKKESDKKDENMTEEKAVENPFTNKTGEVEPSKEATNKDETLTGEKDIEDPLNATKEEKEANKDVNKTEADEASKSTEKVSKEEPKASDDVVTKKTTITTTTEAATETTTTEAPANTSVASGVEEKSKEGKNTVEFQPPVTDSIPFSCRDDNMGCTGFFLVEISTKKQEGLYNLYFHNCGNYEEESAYTVNFTANMIESNAGNYLSAGQIPLPSLYFTMCVVYFIVACYWIYVLRKSTEGVFKLHYLMAVLVYVKTVSLLFHGINYLFIQVKGHREEAFAILYYITYLMKGTLLFITVVLIGSGWTFVKHILSDRDKKIFIVVIPLQILANVAQIIIDETEEGQSQYTMWTEIFILVDLLCCGAILFPVVWSIRHLQEASQTDGKAAINLQKLKIFRHFYIVIVCYIYFTRIIVYLLKITVPFQYEWINELFKELATMIFFIITGYKFRPASSNPYFQIPQEEDDVEMDEVVTKSGALEGLTHVNVRFKDGDNENSGSTLKQLKQRENSHEYD